MPRRDEMDDDDDRPRRRDRDDDDAPRKRRPRDDDEYEDSRPKKKSNLGLILGIIGGVLILLCGGAGVFGWLACRKVSQEFAKVVEQLEGPQANFTQIGTGFHNHNATVGHLPQNTYDRTGKPLLSWRVHLLPYIGQNALYNKFNLNEPWDSPTNKRLLNEMPDIYGTPTTNAQAGPGKTYFRGFSHEGAIFEKPRPGAPQPPQIGIATIPDGTSNTIFIVEAAEAVEWTKPDDLDWSPGRPRPSLGRPGQTWFFALAGDGMTHRVKKDVSDQTLRNLINRQDGNVIPSGWEQ